MASANGDDPVERKIQLTGGSTYTVSLPKEWAREQGIEPGYAVTLYSRDDRLVMTLGDGPEDRQVAEVDGTDAAPADLWRGVRAAYIIGAAEVRVFGSLDSERRLAVEEATGGLVGFEVDREVDDGLIVRSMLDASDLSLEQTIVQMKDLGLSMHEEALAAVIEGKSNEMVARQDDAVDRLLALVSRQFQRSISHVGAASSVSRTTAFNYYTAARQLERVADHAENIAGVASRTDGQPPADMADWLSSFGADSRSVVERSVVALFEGKGSESIRTVLADATDLVGDIEEFERSLHEQGLPDGYLYGVVLGSLARTTEYGINIAETSHQATIRGAVHSE